MTETDKEALELAMKIASKDPTRARQMQDMLDGERNPDGGWFEKPRSWEEVAEFASYVCQTNSLNLPPWSSPPCHPCRDPAGNDGAVKLREQMDEAGVSRWHPNPIKALKEAKANAQEG